MSNAWLAFDDRQALASALAGRTRDLLAQGGELSVSGGSTPIDYFHALRTLPLPWESIDVTLVDERWVDPTHADSNTRLVREALIGDDLNVNFDNAVAPEDPTPEASLARWETILGRARSPTLAVMGMGTDGHTASWFPNSPQLPEALQGSDDKRACVTHTPSSPYPRLTQTLASIEQFAHVILHITGDEKRRVYEQAVNDSALPVSALWRQRAITVYWAP